MAPKKDGDTPCKIMYTVTEMLTCSTVTPKSREMVGMTGK